MCGNYIGRYGLSTACGTPCDGNWNQICGGGLANSVYRVSLNTFYIANYSKQNIYIVK